MGKREKQHAFHMMISEISKCLRPKNKIFYFNVKFLQETSRGNALFILNKYATSNERFKMFTRCYGL